MGKGTFASKTFASKTFQSTTFAGTYDTPTTTEQPFVHSVTRVDRPGHAAVYRKFVTRHDSRKGSST